MYLRWSWRDPFLLRNCQAVLQSSCIIMMHSHWCSYSLCIFISLVIVPLVGSGHPSACEVAAFWLSEIRSMTPLLSFLSNFYDQGLVEAEGAAFRKDSLLLLLTASGAIGR